MKIVKWFIKFGIFLFICGIVFLVGIYIHAYFSPPIELNSANAIVMYDRNGYVFFQGSGGREWVSLENISPYVQKAIISVEDRHFFTHRGFDFLRIIRSLYLNLRTGRITGGGSTISQQYVKNMFLDFDQTWSRKIEEALLTINMEVHFSKEEILEGYLNTINFGQGNFGIESAAQFYFNKSASELTLEQAIILVGIPRSPEHYNPVNNYDRAIGRAWVVARSMLNNGHLTIDQYTNLFSETIPIHGRREDSNNLQTLMYFHDAVINELNNLSGIPKSLIQSGGLRIHTTLDFSIQEEMERSIIENMNDESVQVAAIVTEPSSGGVLALTGGVNHATSQFNRATQARRHVGSTIKPFLYYAALENHMTSASTFRSEETTFVFANNQTYTPTNYGDRYGNKDITMAAALAFSDNIFAVKTHLFIGKQELVDTMRLAGLRGHLDANPSLALGAIEINMLDYAGAFNTLANSGIYNELHFITKVEDAEGRVLFERNINPEQVLNAQNVFILNEMMTATYNPNFVSFNAPTALHMNPSLSRRYAIKTGTTDWDFWIVGYNPDIMMLVWCGNDMNNPVPRSYSRNIRNIWIDTVEFALRDTSQIWYEIPEDIIGLPLNAISGEFDPSNNNNALFFFRRGSEPILNHN